MSKTSRVLIVAGSFVLLCGTLFGVINHEVLDGNRFASHVDAIRSDPAVSQEIGIIITNKVIATDPDLTVARPLIESTASTLVRSSAFGPAIRAMVAPLHQTLTESGGHNVVLRLADVGAVLIAAVSTVAPNATAALPSNFDVTLANFGGQGFAAKTINYAHWVKTLAWLFPLIALLVFAGAVALSRRRRDALRSIGVAITSTGIILAAALLIGAAVAARIPTDTLAGALGVASWHELSGPLWWSAGFTAAAGYLLLWGTQLGAPGDVRESSAAALRWLRDAPDTVGSQLAHGAVLLSIGVAVLVRPLVAVSVVVIAGAFVLALHGLSELVRAAVRGRSESLPALSRLLGRPEVRVGIAAFFCLAIVASLVAWNARPPHSALAAIGPAATTQACNGHVELCNRRYDEVAYPATHNAMSAADQDGWFLAEQPTGLIGQLNAGIRVFLIDTWPGQTTTRKGLVANTPASQAAGLEQARKTYGPAVLASALRLYDATSLTPVGPEQPYLCHAVCQLGSTLWEPEMRKVKTWLDAHPREVVTFFLQDEVSPAGTATVFKDAGLLPMVYSPQTGKPFPTLGSMITSGKRVVVLAENKGGGTTYPWILQGFDWVQDTPYDAMQVSDFSCDRLRGRTDSPLLLINHWLNRPQYRVSDATKVNSAKVLGARLVRCHTQRKHIPNYVAVDFYNRGDLFTEVDRLNEVSP